MPPDGFVLTVWHTQPMPDEDAFTQEQIRDNALALITALLHDDEAATDFVLLNLGVWECRALCVALADYLVQQIQWTARCDGQDATVAWAASLAAVRDHPHGEAPDA